MQNFLLQAGISAPWAQDVLVFLFVAIVGVILGFALGKSRMLGFLLGMYTSLVILQAIPAGILPDNMYTRPAVFVLLSVLIAFLDAYTFNTFLATDAIWKWIILGALNAILMAAILVSLLPQYVPLQIMSYQAYGYFANPWMFLAWVSAPIVFLLVANRTR